MRNFISRWLRWVNLVAQMKEMKNAYEKLVGKLQSKRPLGRPSYRWEDTIKNDLKEIWFEYVDWINLVQHLVQ